MNPFNVVCYYRKFKEIRTRGYNVLVFFLENITKTPNIALFRKRRKTLCIIYYWYITGIIACLTHAFIILSWKENGRHL